MRRLAASSAGAPSWADHLEASQHKLHNTSLAEGEVPYINQTDDRTVEYPVLTGLFMWVTGLPVEDRDRVTATACAMAYDRGARLFRVHDVAGAREALSLAHGISGG